MSRGMISSIVHVTTGLPRGFLPRRSWACGKGGVVRRGEVRHGGCCKEMRSALAEGAGARVADLAVQCHRAGFVHLLLVRGAAVGMHRLARERVAADKVDVRLHPVRDHGLRLARLRIPDRSRSERRRAALARRVRLSRSRWRRGGGHAAGAPLEHGELVRQVEATRLDRHAGLQQRPRRAGQSPTEKLKLLFSRCSARRGPARTVRPAP